MKNFILTLSLFIGLLSACDDSKSNNNNNNNTNNVTGPCATNPCGSQICIEDNTEQELYRCVECINDETTSQGCDAGQVCGEEETCENDCYRPGSNPCENGYVCAPGSGLCILDEAVCDNCPEDGASCVTIGGISECICDPGVDIEGCSCASGYTYYPEYGCINEGFADSNRNYEWYRTQMGTGPAEGSNCGPTSVAMASHWWDEAFNTSVETIRSTITPGDTGWWYTNHIEQALTNLGTPWRILEASKQNILDTLDNGSVLLICINMGYITQAMVPAETHYNRFYSYDSGHFLIVKGYIDDGQWLIVHDPNNWSGDYYDANQTMPMGLDRYYHVDEVVASMLYWWGYFFEIGVSGGKAGFDIPIGRSGP
ncbi:C39 family peptidase [Myxococcota bacterium]|nr:C39 family peptidase [Myxococcota bacterium]MBU1496182.1 C39 family peptidase [Myxococcota bacterium]